MKINTALIGASRQQQVSQRGLSIGKPSIASGIILDQKYQQKTVIVSKGQLAPNNNSTISNFLPQSQIASVNDASAENICQKVVYGQPRDQQPHLSSSQSSKTLICQQQSRETSMFYTDVLHYGYGSLQKFFV